MILTLCWILFLSTGPHAVYLATNSSENRPLVECSLIDASGGKFDALKESNLCRPNGTSMPNAYQVSNPVLPSKEFIFSTSAQFHSEITSARQDTSTSLQVDGLHSGSWGLPRQGTQSVFEEESLVGLLLSIITHTMRDCALTIAYDGAFSSRDLLRALFILPNPRLVVRLTSANDFNGLLWKSALCRGYIFLLSRSDILDAFSNRGDYVWDFGGRYVIVGLSKTELEALSISKKISKTENLLGVVKYPRLGEWGVYVNQVIRDVGVSRVALWRNGRFTNEPMFFLDQLDDLREKLLRVITFQWEPSVMYRKNKEGQVTELYGKDVMVVKALAQALNAKLVYLDVPKGEVWGTRVGNGTNWNGLMGYLQRGEADIGIANMFITNINNRMDVADFSTPFDAEFSCFLSRVPKPLPEWERILYPFQVNVWISFILGFFLMGFLLNAFARAGRASGGEKNDLQSLSFSCLYTCGVHLSEGQALLPIRGGTRVFISFLWLYTIIITTGYCSNLTAFLTVSREPSTLDTIKALAESSLQVAGLGHFFGKALASSSNPYLKTLSTKYTAYEHHEDVWPLVLDGAAVNLESRRYLVYVMETQFTHHGVSTVRLVKETFAPYSIGLTTQRSSPLKRKFDLLLNKMVEAGLVQYWFVESLRIAKQEADRKRQSQQDYDDDKEKASGSGSTTENGSKEEVQQEIPSETGVRSIGLRHMQGNFFALVIGFFGATLIFLGELMFGEKPPGRG